MPAATLTARCASSKRMRGGKTSSRPSNPLGALAATLNIMALIQLLGWALAVVCLVLRLVSSLGPQTQSLVPDLFSGGFRRFHFVGHATERFRVSGLVRIKLLTDIVAIGSSVWLLANLERILAGTVSREELLGISVLGFVGLLVSSILYIIVLRRVANSLERSDLATMVGTLIIISMVVGGILGGIRGGAHSTNVDQVTGIY